MRAVLLISLSAALLAGGLILQPDPTISGSRSNDALPPGPIVPATAQTTGIAGNANVFAGEMVPASTSRTDGVLFAAACASGDVGAREPALSRPNAIRSFTPPALDAALATAGSVEPAAAIVRADASAARRFSDPSPAVTVSPAVDRPAKPAVNPFGPADAGLVQPPSAKSR